MSNQDVIAAVASPPGMGAVSLIRLSGTGVFEVAEKMLKRFRKDGMRPRYTFRDDVLDAEGRSIDDVLVVVYQNPGSYTGEDVVEISGHGGIHVTRRVLERCLECGARPAEAGEFSLRAFLNSKLDLTQAEAVMDLITAQTDLAAKAAREQLSGNLGQAVASMREEIINLVAHVEAYIDFPEEDISPDTGAALEASFVHLRDVITGLLGTARRGRLLREGARVAIVGAPNAGKSSLLNALLGFDRAIVSAEAGTTRDTVEEVLDFEGYPVRLIDTAGLREEGSTIEKEGMARARQRMEEADLVVELVDASQAPGARLAEGALLVLNKTDLGEDGAWKDHEALRISVLEERGLDELRREVAKRLGGGAVGNSGGALIAINARHQDCLRRAEESLEEARQMLVSGEEPEFVSLPLREALHAVGEIAGRIDTDEILGSIFSQFCIGK
ncbi:tRNA uridine-5-carboxymethylaminomethyl(34) synthesis GTPase MnmE [Roseibacillus persicicus]|uniref:tRNA modification GTPase MnmE n=1 Tax=Roseibacillus persicicus TaxID=454148 RepID=A0A918TKG8_9BACT|nr:tRNA uridine-5-carboxymethylaminomethyl(34) synthesis GTPase MnmE [Roseibacillus persicicus]MDQ8189957.1 tRNA uridine-5-carboxymethylaminomethyl(34) synthesis GTPase MnmE [Roseibacillus persicicus]GHC51183.1 tRNA modification GTPase MnmE [Roseibacillus persicicus]